LYVYIKSEECLWTVGFYNPKGEWLPECDCCSKEEAAARVNYLNGGGYIIGKLVSSSELKNSPDEIVPSRLKVTAMKKDGKEVLISNAHVMLIGTEMAIDHLS